MTPAVFFFLLLLFRFITLAGCALVPARTCSPAHPHRQAARERGGQPRREPGPAGAPADRLDVEAPDHGHDHGLHLHQGQLLAHAHARAGLEHGVPVRALGHEAPVPEPPLGPELAAVGAPHGLHPPHGVGVVGHPRALRHRRAVRERVVARRELGVELHRREQPHALVQRRVHVVHALELAEGGVREPPVVAVAVVVVAGDAGGLVPDGGRDLRVVGEEQEEGGQRRGHGVAAGQHEADHDVAEVLVVVDGPHEARQEVAARAGGAPELAPLPDHLRGERVHEVHRVPEPPLVPQVEQALQLPDDVHGRGGAPGGERGGRVEGVLERGHRHRQLQAARVEAEGDLADAVEGEAAEHVLQVQDPASSSSSSTLAAGGTGSRAEQGDEPAPQLGRHHAHREGAQRRRRQLGRRELALEQPGVPVHVEDPAAEEVGEDGRERGALGVVVEAGAQHVVDGGRVGREHVPEHVHVDGLRRRGPQQVGVPVAEVVEVAGPRRRQVRLAHGARAPPRRPHAQHGQQGGQRYRARRGHEEHGGHLRLHRGRQGARGFT
uniref:Uncharacterized protein n=1 Tax=Zea mays TaxID=4577 RepID=A0A804QXB7_MAIZE